MREKVAELFGLSLDAPHLEQALTHPSYANERRDAPDNQRLEFLGDAVLGFCTSAILFARFPSADEGTLTRMRARLVNADALADFAREHGIAAALLLGRGAEVSGLRERTNVLADAVEALIAAAFLDQGLDGARRACERVVAAPLGSLELDSGRDPKSELQERVQAVGEELPVYEVVDSGGPAHERWFEVSARIAGREVGRGRGRSKRLAEFAAARAALGEQALVLQAEDERK
jgi:ribonuclease III